MYDYNTIAEQLLLDASDFIGKDPKRFGDDNHALETIRANEQFRAYVKNRINSSPYEYGDLDQEAAAHVVWGLYQTWTY